MQSILECFEDVEVAGAVEHSEQYHLKPSLELFLLKHLSPTIRNFLHGVKKRSTADSAQDKSPVVVLPRDTEDHAHIIFHQSPLGIVFVLERQNRVKVVE